MKIAIDGMDGVGKSSVAKLLGKELNYPVYETKLVEKIGMDPLFYKKLVKYVRKSNNKTISQLFFMLKSLLDNEEDNVIAVRSIVSMYYFEHNNLSNELIDSIINTGIVPDLVILLYAPVEERIKRIKNRNEFDSDLNNKEALEDGYDIMLDFIKKYNIPYLGIDTTNRSLESVSLLVKLLIEGYDKTLDKEEYLNIMNKKYGFEHLYQIGGDSYEKVLKRY